MRHHDAQFNLKEVEKLCQLYQDCQLTVLEETELEYVLAHCDFDSPVIKETKGLMTVSRSVKFAANEKPHKSVWKWVPRVAACAALVLGIAAIYHANQSNDNCIVYVSGEKANDEIAHEIAEADVAKMQQFMQVVNEQKAAEEEKVKQFTNHINQSK
ncbi:MAG: hypothetical protein J6X70_04030 [Muribaculaceae bacterium]|nr:hypothetical protein [Muribaculaceae bacterium]